MIGWLRTLRGDALRARDARAEQAIRDAKPRERLDVPFGVLVLVGVTGLAWFGYGVALTIERSGLFDPEIVRPLPDARVLRNLRQSEAPFIGAAGLGDGEGAVVMLRQDGQLSWFHESTGLVTHRTIEPRQTGFETDLAGLSAGCGRQGAAVAMMPCPTPDRLFLLSQGGGLAQSDNGRRWDVRLRDAAWTGPDGTQVEQDDVLAWASSGDGRFVAIFAGPQGLAVLDQQDDSWAIVSDIARLQEAATQAPVHLLSDGNDFWFGTANGLAQLDPRANTVALEWSSDRVLVRDLDLTTAGDLIMLTEGACPSNIGAGCLSIVQVSELNQRRVLAGEVEKILTLSDDTIRHAVLQDGKIVVVDAAGIYAYDPQSRTWRTIVAGTVDAFWVDAQSGEIAATLADRLVQVARGLITSSRSLAGAPFSQVEVTSSGRILGLARDGQLRDLQNDAVLASRDGALPDGVTFHAGGSRQARVLLASTSGILVHDVTERRFWWKEAAALTPDAQQLLSRSIDLHSAANAIWAVDMSRGTIATVSVTGAIPNVTVELSQPQILARPLRSVTSDPSGLLVVDADGRPLRFTPSSVGPQVQSQIGDPRAGSGDFVTAAGYDQGILFATRDRIWPYDQQTRDWDPSFLPPNGTRIADISVGDGLYLLSDRGQVFRQNEAGWDTLIGSGNGAQVALADVTDAASLGTSIYLGGAGKVQVYDLAQSAFGHVYQGGQGHVRIVDLAGGRPVWLSNGELRHGDDLMTRASVGGAWSAADGIVALASGPNNTQFTIHWDTPTGAPRCTFLSARPPQGQVIEALGLQGDRVLTVTTGGVGLYVEAERRWLTVAGITPSPDVRLFTAGGQLVAMTGQRIMSMPLADLPIPDNCASPQISLSWKLREEGQSAAFDQATGQAVILKSDGRILRWANGAVAPILPAPNDGPAHDTLTQAARVGDTLVFPAVDGIWRYDLVQRRWHFATFVLPAGAGSVSEVDVAALTTQQAGVTLWTQSGQSFVGTWELGAETVAMSRARAPTLASLRTAPAEIIDISETDGNWLIASSRGVEVTRPGVDAPLANIAFPQGAGVSATPIRIAGNIAFVDGELEAINGLFILPPNAAITEQNGALKDLSFTYVPGSDRDWGVAQDGRKLWRIDAQGAVWSCEIAAGRSSETGCVEDLAAPLNILASSIGLAFENAEATYAVYDSEFVRFDRALRTVTPINGPAPQSDAEAIEFSRHVLFWDGVGQTLWQIDGTEARTLVPAVQRIARSGRYLMIKTADRVLRLADSSDVTVSDLNQELALGAVSFDWMSGGDVSGLDSARVVRSESGTQLFALPLPDPESIRFVAPQSMAFIWLQRRDGTVQAFSVQECERPRNPHGAVRSCLSGVPGSQLLAAELGQLISAKGEATATLTFENGVVDFDGKAFGAPQPSAMRAMLPQRLSDQRAALVQRISISPSGLEELAPAVIQDGRRGVESGTDQILATLAGEPESVAAMTLGWLRWDRQAVGFDIAGQGGARVAVTPTQFIRDGRMLIDFAGVARNDNGQDGFEWITPHSIWRFNDVAAAPSLVALIDLPTPVGLNAGRLLFPDGQGLAPGATMVDADLDTSAIVAGALRITSQWRSQTVLADLTRIDGTQEPAFAAVGFQHDTRSGAGWTAQEPVLATPVGLVSPSGFQSVLPLPDGNRPQKLTQVRGRSFARIADEWWRFDQTAGGWIAALDPLAQRELADIGGVVWSLDQGAFSLAARDPADGWRIDRDGLQFKADQLIALAASPEAVVIGTGLGTHELTNARAIAGLGPPDVATVPVASFDSLALTPRDHLLFAGAGTSAPVVWDQATKNWVAPLPDRAPWSARRAIATQDLQLDIFDRGTPVVRRAVEQIYGTRRFARFEWRRGGFMPFDRANGLTTDGGNVYVGTDMGLRVFDGAPSQRDRLIDLSAIAESDDRPIAPVTRIGRPMANSVRLLARDQAGGCVEIGTDNSLGLCSDPDKLDVLWVEDDDLWLWSKSATGLNGNYVLAQSANRPLTTNPQGRWPHDSLNAHAVCRGQSVEVWSDGQTLREGGLTQDLGRSGWVGALCQSDAAELSPTRRLEAGLYLVSENGSPPLLRVGPSQWAPVVSDLTQAIAARAAGDWAFEAGRLRVRARGDAEQGYEYRPTSGIWHVMPWEGGLPAMDGTIALQSDGNRVLRMTPLGMMDQALTGRALVIDPDQVLFRTTDDPVDFASCLLDRIARLDGRGHAMAAQPGSPVVLRCQDGRILHEDTANTGDYGGFDTVTDDPFADRIAIAQTNGWRWTIADTQAGRTPVISVTFRDEVVSLAAGRFDLDDYRSIAAPFVGRIGLVSGLGLWEHPLGDLSVSSGVRPADIPDLPAVTGITGDRDQITGTLLLCVERLDSPAVAYSATAEPRQVEACFDWRGNDASFQYRHQEAQGASAAVIAANGPLVARTILAGQFVDRVAVGLPQPVGTSGDLLVPTPIGASLLAADGQAKALYVHADVLGAATLPQAGPSILTRSGVFSLSGESAACAAFALALPLIPADYAVQGITSRGASSFQFHGIGRTGPFAVTIDCDTEQLQGFSQEFDVDARNRHVTQMRSLLEATASFSVRQMADGRIVLSDGRTRQFVLEGVRGQLLGVYGTTQPRGAVIVTDQDAYLLDVDAAISALAAMPAIQASDPATFAPTRTQQPVQMPAIALDPPPVPSTAPFPSTPPREPVQRPQSRSRELPPFVINNSGEYVADLSAADPEIVAAIQEALSALGHYDGSADGLPGPLTRAAILEFQRSIGDEQTANLTVSQFLELVR